MGTSNNRLSGAGRAAGVKVILIAFIIALAGAAGRAQALEKTDGAPDRPAAEHGAVEIAPVDAQPAADARPERPAKFIDRLADRNPAADAAKFNPNDKNPDAAAKGDDAKKKSAPDAAPPGDPAGVAGIETGNRFRWRAAVTETMNFLIIQHGMRSLQKKTYREFDGPFLRDWGVSVRNLRGWSDGDNFLINYIAHPLQGGVTGRIFVNNSERARRQEFGSSREYWKSRLKAALWSTVWNVQFELGPFSEASIGNVGLERKNGKSSMAYVDLVITPTLGTGVMIGEDAIDKYVLKNWLERKAGRATIKIKLLRSVLTPTTSFTNLLRGKPPWKRDDRFN